MCLKVNETMTREGLKGKRIHPNQMVKVWKVVRALKVVKELKVCRRALWSPYKGHTWNPGWNKSNRANKECVSGFVYKGIHVFLTRKEARKYVKRYSEIVIPVYVYKKDLIGIGFIPSFAGSIMTYCVNIRSAAFMKVFFKKEDYDKAMLITRSTNPPKN